ncbi:MAG: Hsp20/alpha crystallin family protein, partial [Halobacteriota archaeon]
STMYDPRFDPQYVQRPATPPRYGRVDPQTGQWQPAQIDPTTGQPIPARAVSDVTPAEATSTVAGSAGPGVQPQGPQAPPPGETIQMTAAKTAPAGETAETVPAVPAIDITESDEDVLVTIDMPGFEKDNILLQTDDHALIVTAERELDVEEDHRLVHQERATHVKRVVQLPPGATSEDATASHKNGVCRITIPKAEPDNRRTIGFE